MEREADVPDEAGLARLDHLVDQAEASRLVEQAAVHRVEQVDVQVIGLQLLELGREVLVEVLGLANQRQR